MGVASLAVSCVSCRAIPRVVSDLSNLLFMAACFDRVVLERCLTDIYIYIYTYIYIHIYMYMSDDLYLLGAMCEDMNLHGVRGENGIL